jgi:hypothetical protein
MPKHTRQMVDRWFGPAADKTMRKTETAKGPPKDRGRLVTRMKMGPRRLRVRSLAASEAEVLAARYSPPVYLLVKGRKLVF